MDAAPINKRPLYPYSIIPGGAYNRDELARAIQNDPVVARHYVSFEVGKTRIVRLDHDELMYVSYRIGNNVFWTKHPLFVPKGETLLTDGKTAARTRCGNRLSATPAVPISPDQPRPDAIDAVPNLDQPIDPIPQPELSFLLPPASLLPTPSTQMVLGAPVNEGSTASLPSPIPPLVFPVVGGGPESPAVPVLPVATPEPSTLVLLAAGVVVIFALCWRKALWPRR